MPLLFKYRWDLFYPVEVCRNQKTSAFGMPGRKDLLRKKKQVR